MICRTDDIDRRVNRSALLINQRSLISCEKKYVAMLCRRVITPSNTGLLRSSLRSLKVGHASLPVRKTPAKKSNEYFVDFERLRKTSSKKIDSGAKNIENTLRKRSHGGNSMVGATEARAFITANHNESSKKAIRWDTFSQAKRPEPIIQSSYKKRMDQYTLQRSPFGKELSESRTQYGLSQQSKPDIQGSKRIKSILDQISKSSNKKRDNNSTGSHQSNLNIELRRKEKDECSSLESKSNQTDSLIRNKNLKTAMSQKERVKSQSFATNIKGTESFRNQILSPLQESKVENNQKDNCSLLMGMNSILKGWKSCFPQMFIGINESTTDLKTAKERLDSVQKSFHQAFKVKRNLAVDLMKGSADYDKRITILLSENIFLMESIQELIETNLSCISKGLQEDGQIREIFGNSDANI